MRREGEAGIRSSSGMSHLSQNCVKRSRPAAYEDLVLGARASKVIKRERDTSSVGSFLSSLETWDCANGEDQLTSRESAGTGGLNELSLMPGARCELTVEVMTTGELPEWERNLASPHAF